MKVVEQTTERVRITSEAPRWAKLICWCFSLFFLSMLYWGENYATNIVAIIGAVFFIVVTTSIADTIFDIENNKIYGRYQLCGLNWRNLDLEMSTCEFQSIQDRAPPKLFLVVPGGKKYAVGDFFTVGEHNTFMNNVLGSVPISRSQNF